MRSKDSPDSEGLRARILELERENRALRDAVETGRVSGAGPGSLTVLDALFVFAGLMTPHGVL